MRPIDQIGAAMTLDELEIQQRMRDERVSLLRNEMGVIHKLMESKWDAIARANAGPSHLAQTVGLEIPQVKLGGM